MTEPTFVTAPSIETDLPRINKGMMSGLVMFGCLVMLGYLAYILFKSDRRLDRYEVEYRQAVQNIQDRANGSPKFDADGCGSDCNGGHTYKTNCRLHVSGQSSAPDTL